MAFLPPLDHLPLLPTDLASDYSIQPVRCALLVSVEVVIEVLAGQKPDPKPVDARHALMSPIDVGRKFPPRLVTTDAGLHP